MLGDQTARYQGRLTLNPLKHLDPVGSIIVPILTSLGGFVFGWAKPVPFNPYNLRSQRWGELIVAIVGPISNLVLAIIFGILIRLVLAYHFLPLSFVQIAATVVAINLVLAVFNLVPIPPLDGSKVLFGLLPVHLQYIRTFLEQYSLILIIIFIFFLWKLFLPLVSLLFGLFTGLPLGL